MKFPEANEYIKKRFDKVIPLMHCIGWHVAMNNIPGIQAKITIEDCNAAAGIEKFCDELLKEMNNYKK